MAFGSSAVFLLVISVSNCFGIFNTSYVDVCLSLFTPPHPQPEMNLKHTLKLSQKPIISFNLLQHVDSDYCDQSVQRKHCLHNTFIYWEILIWFDWIPGPGCYWVHFAGHYLKGCCYFSIFYTAILFYSVLFEQIINLSHIIIFFSVCSQCEPDFYVFRFIFNQRLVK